MCALGLINTTINSSVKMKLAYNQSKNAIYPFLDLNITLSVQDHRNLRNVVFELQPSSFSMIHASSKAFFFFKKQLR